VTNEWQIRIKSTFNGDANGDGAVDADDYARIDAGYASGGKGWENGDFDYSGRVDGDDYFLIDRAFGEQGVIGAAPAAVPPEAEAAVSAAVGLEEESADSVAGTSREAVAAEPVAVVSPEVSKKERKKNLHHERPSFLEGISVVPKRSR
jgi:hypothetical protein